MLKDLIISRVRVKVLELYLLNPNRIFHLRKIQRKTGEAMNAIRREMSYLQRKGFFSCEKRSNRLYYRLKESHPLYYPLLTLVNITSGLGREILKKRVKLGKIKFVMLSGRFVRNLQREKNEVDLLIVGRVVLPELSQIIRAEEKKRGKEINYTLMTEEEFSFRKKRRDPFVLQILQGSRIMVVGDEEELVK